jgi:cytoskeletal protein CcmA (bactofilin family)
MGIFGKPPETKGSESALGLGGPAPAHSTHSAPAAPSAPSAPPSRCVIGAKTVVKGEVTGEEDILVEGALEGQVRISRELRVGPTGSVKASVEAAAILVSGEIVGDCTAQTRVEVQSTGRLTGNIRAPRVVIAEGAMFRGNSDMSPRKDAGTRETKDKV